MTRIIFTITLLTFVMLAESFLGGPGRTPEKLTFPEEITIGGVFRSEALGEKFLKEVEARNRDMAINGTVVKGVYITMVRNPILAAQAVCEKLLVHRIYGVIASHSPASGSPVAISFTCGFYMIPVIGISTRESAFSDKNVHGYFLRTVAPFANQAEAWASILEHLHYSKVIFLYADDAEGRAMLGHFQSAVEDRNVQIENTVALSTQKTSFKEELLALTTNKFVSKVFVLFADREFAGQVYRDADELTGPGYVWLVTEEALYATNTPIGVLGLQQKYATDTDEDQERHMNDAVRIFFGALHQLKGKGKGLALPKTSCSDRAHTKKSKDASEDFLQLLKNQSFKGGDTGTVKFDEAGDRIYEQYDIMNRNRPDKLTNVGQYISLSRNPLSLYDDQIIWPGKQDNKPKGIRVETQLKIVTISEVPFTYNESREIGEECDFHKGKIPCNHTNPSGVTKYYCCHGYAVDLLIKLMDALNLTRYKLHIVGDGQYGARSNSDKNKWTGLIKEIIDEKADMIVAPLTIDPDRAKAIEFSKPFKYQGLTVLVKKATKESSLDSFLQPFHGTLWILVGLSVHVVALVLYLLDRFSPFGRYKLAKNDDTEEDALNLSGAVWFAWGVLLNSGIGEGTPRSFSARVLGMVWAGFAMIIVASYTANLAAFLVLDRPEGSISGIDDARLRNPQDSFKYVTVKNSSVAMYFKRQVELSTMYRTLEARECCGSTEEAIHKIRTGDYAAFIWDSSRLNFEAANDCLLVTSGELFGRSGYAIGLPKTSPWTPEVSQKILEFHENGTMEELDNKWILVKDNNCAEKEPSPATLGLQNMAGVFMMVAGGIVTGVFLIFVEILYKRHRGLKEKELGLARTTVNRWRANVEKRRTLRKTLQQQQLEERVNGDGVPNNTTTRLV